MVAGEVTERQRQRAPSKRALETRARIFDAAEQLFAERGYEGASIRDIARLAGVQGALVAHHGGSKEELFETVVARRANELGQLRLEALDALQETSLRGVLRAFVAPFLDKVLNGGPEWQAYGRLIAHVSSDDRWQGISEKHFDPVAKVFLKALADNLPNTAPDRLSAGFVFTVSAMLSLCASRWRIAALSEGNSPRDPIEMLLDFCEAGFAQV